MTHFLICKKYCVIKTHKKIKKKRNIGITNKLIKQIQIYKKSNGLSILNNMILYKLFKAQSNFKTQIT